MIWTTMINGMGVRLTTADRAVGDGVKGTSQKEAIIKILDQYKDLGTIGAYTMEEKDYPGETGEEAWSFSIPTRTKHQATAIAAAICVLDDKHGLTNPDAPNRKLIDGKDPGEPLNPLPVGRPNGAS